MIIYKKIIIKMDKHKYKKHIPMTQKILNNKVETYCEKNGYEVYRLTNHEDYHPSKDMIPSLVESIKFWQSQRPKGDSVNWTKIQWTLYWQIKTKEIICLELLGKADKGFWKRLKLKI